MDCIIPHHSVRMFCAAITACAKIGKDLYVDFHPIDGLCLRTLNDAKSAYVCYQFQPSFFEQCTAPPCDIWQQGRRKKRRQSQDSSPSQRSSRRGDRRTSSASSATNDEEDDDHLTCRLAIKALTAAVRQRKNVQSLRIYAEQVASSLHLSFEYLLSPSGMLETTTSCFRVVHRVPVADFPVAIVSAVVTCDVTASEMVVSPRTLLRLLEPLARQAETAWLIPSPTREHQMVATCFQQQHHASGGSSEGTATNALLSSSSHLQTEMRLSYDDLQEMDFVDDRNLDDDDTNRTDTDAPPPDVNESVALVFSHREAKALLHWASSSGSALEEMPVRASFHWGGKPLVFQQQKAEAWNVELVLATLDHKLIRGNHSDDGN